jgi:hypothetical protein
MPSSTASDHLAGVREVLTRLDPEGLSARERLDLIPGLEELKAVAAAAQVRVAESFDTSARCAHISAGGDPAKASRSIGSQLALALHTSPHRGDEFRALSTALVDQMPETLAALSRGAIGEHHARVAFRATSGLAPGMREQIDAALSSDLGTLSPRQLDAACRRIAASIDAAAVVDKIARAARSCRVTVHPAPEGMAYLSVLGPLPEVVGAYAALKRAAEAVVAGADEDEGPEGRGVGAIMTDRALRLLSNRAVGQGQPVMVNLVITDRALLGEGDPGRSVDEPGQLPGHGPLAAPDARAWLSNPATPARIRRLFTTPNGRDLTQMESRSRVFTGALAEIIGLRDQCCAAPWCDAPIRDVDHVTRHSDGGPTSYRNGQGLCERCNDVKEQPGWVVTRASGAGTDAAGVTTWTTPTGQVHSTSPPPILGPGWRPNHDILAESPAA